MTPAHSSVTVDGARVAYRRAGSGPVLLFLHGSGGVFGWAPWMDELARTYDVIVPDHPGWGDSTAPLWVENVHDIAYLYLDFTDALQLDNIHLVGNSIGGWIACQMLVKTLARFASLTLVAPAGWRGNAPPSAGSGAPLSANESLRRLYFDKTIADRLAAAPGATERATLQQRNRLASDRIAGQPRCHDPQLLRWMHRITLPTLIVWGAEDEVLPQAHLAQFVRLIPGARGVTIARAGHLPHAERTAEFLTAFDDFTGAHTRSLT